MAGASWRVEVSDDQARQLLARLVREGQDLKPLFDEVGSALEDSTRKRFDSETAPDGTGWVKISEPWRKRKERKGLNPGILKATGDLANSIRWESTAEYVEIIAGPVEYSAIHQYGGETGAGHAVKMPPRPYLGLSADDEADVSDAMSSYLAGLLRGS